MAKRQGPRQIREGQEPGPKSSVKQPPARSAKADTAALVDAIAEIVHQGYGRLLDGYEMMVSLDGWKPNCSMNYEYVFARNSHSDITWVEVNRKRLNRQFLRKVVKDSARAMEILGGSPMTPKEQEAYRLQVARRKYGYMRGEERLKSGTDCKWVDLSFLTDSKGREVYILEMADAITDADVFTTEGYERVWHWKDQGIEYIGPFASSEEAEKWMVANGAFEEVD